MDPTVASGIIIALIAAVVSVITAILSFRGKRVDAVEWLTDRLREDAEAVRERLREEGESYEGKIDKLEEAVSGLQEKEAKMLEYINSLEQEIKDLRYLVKQTFELLTINHIEVGDLLSDKLKDI